MTPIKVNLNKPQRRQVDTEKIKSAKTVKELAAEVAELAEIVKAMAGGTRDTQP